MADLLGRHAPSAGKAIPQLDTLRGIGIVSVFVQHLGDRYLVLVERAISGWPASVQAWILTVFHHAWWGVDLFFVLSGFSLGLAYLRSVEKSDAEPSAKDFLVRRAARIVPGFYAALALVLITRHALLFLPGFFPSLLVHLALLEGYVQPGGIIIIGASWTLTTEAHYYLLFPLLAPLLLRRRRWGIGLAICAGVWALRAALHAAVLEPGVRTAMFELTQRRLIVSRLDQFVLGSLAALAYLHVERTGLAERAARLAPWVLAATVPFLVIVFRLEGELFLEPGGSWPYALMSLGTTAVVLAAALLDGKPAAIFAAPPLSSLGVVSYGVFLNHQLILGFVDWFAPFATRDPTWGRLAFVGPVALGLSTVVGIASWRLIERPAMTWARKLQRPRQTTRDHPSGPSRPAAR